MLLETLANVTLLRSSKKRIEKDKNELNILQLENTKIVVMSNV